MVGTPFAILFNHHPAVAGIASQRPFPIRSLAMMRNLSRRYGNFKWGLLALLLGLPLPIVLIVLLFVGR
jgi:hypothetical protein